MDYNSAMIQPNTYFDDHVRSLGYADDQGKATVGVMLPGEYTFNTAAPETMTVITGRLTVKLPGDEAFFDYDAPASFEVPGDSAFALKVATPTAYLCRFH